MFRNKILIKNKNKKTMKGLYGETEVMPLEGITEI